jgi:hypothetical protein
MMSAVPTGQPDTTPKGVWLSVRLSPVVSTGHVRFCRDFVRRRQTVAASGGIMATITDYAADAPEQSSVGLLGD